jgi:3-hydroxybutyryl-CoA dehydrogenase
MDLTGLDVSHPVMESIYHQYYEEARYRPSPLTKQMLEAKQLGRKVGQVFMTIVQEAKQVKHLPKWLNV